MTESEIGIPKEKRPVTGRFFDIRVSHFVIYRAETPHPHLASVRAGAILPHV